VAEAGWHDNGMRPGPGFRLTRSAVFAGVCVTVTGLGHGLMSGAGLPVWALLYAFASVAAGAWWFTGRRRGALFMTGATVLTQLLLHGVFLLGQLIARMNAVAAREQHVGAASRMTGTAGSMSAGGGMHMHEWTLGMLAAHTVAALICGLWLWRGEVAAGRLARVLASLVAAPLRRARRIRAPRLPLPPVPPRAGPRPRVGPYLVLIRHTVTLRGPPGVLVRP
jgi:hypothetical protein